jgi:hypothetical protein
MVGSGKETGKTKESLIFPVKDASQTKVPPVGLEPAVPMSQAEPDTPVTATTDDTLGQSLDNGAHNGAQIDAELARVLNAWPKLPTALKAGILAMIDAARK